MTPQQIKERVLKERRCHIWQQIEKGLFSPAGQSDQRTWCDRFVVSLKDLWGDESLVVGPRFPRATISLPLPGFALEYDLSNWSGSPRRASLRMTFKDVNVATYHIDHAFDDRVSLYVANMNNVLNFYPNKASRSTELLADICWVLDRFVFHPCAHIHLSPDILSHLYPIEDTFSQCLHEIRFAGGITNPFAALFQYRVNMVLRQTPEEIRDAKLVERNRIAAIMRDAILSEGRTPNVSAGVLFDGMR